MVEVLISNDNFKNETTIEEISKTYNLIIESAKKLKVWSETIQKIIITDSFEIEILNKSKEWGIEAEISKEKEYTVVSKTLYNNNIENPKHIIFFNFYSFFENEYPHLEIALGQIINIHSDKIIPKKLRTKFITKNPNSLEEYIELASIEWCKAEYSKKIKNQILNEDSYKINNNSLLIAFKRKLKNNLFEYNSDKYDNEYNLNVFWKKYFESIKTLFLRIIEKKENQNEYSINENEPSLKLINQVLTNIEKLTHEYVKKGDFDVTNLKKSIINFSEHFEIFLENETDKNFKIRLTKNPKDYFLNEIVETEPRIICFMDILGFSELINQYESNISSTVLQDIQESFKLAKTHLLEKNISGNDDIVKHLKYQTFSDNICISIPYFDNEEDFLLNLNLLLIYVRGFQNIMMSKDIFMRGAISTGSYYADDNIIFSTGLVKAYHLESKKAIYPRIIIDKDIIDKLFNYNRTRIEYYGLDKIIVFDWENCAFINPFGFIQSSIEQFEKVTNEINQEFIEIDEMDNFTKLINNLTKNISDLTLDIMKNLSKNEQKSIEPIKTTILNNIYIHNNNSNVASKYIWLNEFIKWFEKDKSAKLKFETMNQRLKQY